MLSAHWLEGRAVFFRMAPGRDQRDSANEIVPGAGMSLIQLKEDIVGHRTSTRQGSTRLFLQPLVKLPRQVDGTSKNHDSGDFTAGGR